MENIDIYQFIAKIKGKAKENSITIQTICKEAGLHNTTFSRWMKKSVEPKYNNLMAVQAALNKILKTKRKIKLQKERRELNKITLKKK